MTIEEAVKRYKNNAEFERTHGNLQGCLEFRQIAEWLEKLEQEPFINKPCVSSGVCEHDKNKALDKIRAEITDCLKALDEIEKSGLNIYLPNEISGRRLTYQQCLKFIDKYKSESEHN